MKNLKSLSTPEIKGQCRSIVIYTLITGKDFKKSGHRWTALQLIYILRLIEATKQSDYW
jgi:hypothetical protein